MRIPKDVILIWPKLASQIPASWTRETLLDGRFLKAVTGVDPNTTGGAATHTHSSPAHSHTLSNHVHTFNLTSVNNNVNGASTSGQALAGPSHYHTGSTTSTVGGTTGTTAVTYGSCSNNPPFYEVIFIKAGDASLLENDIVVLWSKETLPNNYLFCNGSSGTPDMRNRYLRGAATSGDAGAVGGSLTNVHDITHTHSTTTHYHTATTGAARDQNGNFFNSGVSTSSPQIYLTTFNHSHSFNTSSDHQGIAQFTGSLTTLETVEPEHVKMIPIQKKANAIKEPGIIGLWLGELNDIPDGWKLHDTLSVNDKFLKMVNTLDEVGDAGGSNTHTHAAQSHSHSGSAGHTHTASNIGHTGTLGLTSGGFTNLRVDGAFDQPHSMTAVQSVNAPYNSSTTTANESNNEPEYRTVALIEFVKDRFGAGVLYNFL